MAVSRSEAQAYLDAQALPALLQQVLNQVVQEQADQRLTGIEYHEDRRPPGESARMCTFVEANRFKANATASDY